MIEIFKDIKGYEGLYQISNFGNVKSLKRDVITENGVVRHIPEMIKKPSVNRKGYLKINLCKNGSRKSFTIHRLVAMAFIPNPENKPQINHRDENKQNNNVDNLEWCTCKENINYGNHNIKISQTVKNKQLKNAAKSVLCNGTIFKSIQECASYFNVGNDTLGYWLKGKRPMPQNFIDMGLQYA